MRSKRKRKDSEDENGSIDGSEDLPEVGIFSQDFKKNCQHLNYCLLINIAFIDFNFSGDFEERERSIVNGIFDSKIMCY